MDWNLLFFLNSALLGVGLAMDAFSVSLANGLNEPYMKKNKMCGVAGTYAFFQFAMPMIGWICVHTILQFFKIFENFIPWIALGLLLYIGITMLVGALKKDEKDGENEKQKTLGFKALLIQGIATSIDALSVGFTIAEYQVVMALVSSLIIAVVTFIICMAGLTLGKKFGTKLSNKAEIVGAIILIGIGIEIWVKGFLLTMF